MVINGGVGCGDLVCGEHVADDDIAVDVKQVFFFLIHANILQGEILRVGQRAVG